MKIINSKTITYSGRKKSVEYVSQPCGFKTKKNDLSNKEQTAKYFLIS